VIEKYKLFEEFKVVETNEPVVNEVIELKPIENKEMEITLGHDDFLETSSEVKFTSMELQNFPIKYRNFSKDLEPLKTNFLGMTDVDFGNVRLEGVSIDISPDMEGIADLHVAGTKYDKQKENEDTKGLLDCSSLNGSLRNIGMRQA